MLCGLTSSSREADSTFPGVSNQEQRVGVGEPVGGGSVLSDQFFLQT